MNINNRQKGGNNNNNNPYDLHKFRPGKREHVLDDAVLDDATRRDLMREIMSGPPIPRMQNNPSSQAPQPPPDGPAKPGLRRTTSGLARLTSALADPANTAGESPISKPKMPSSSTSSVPQGREPDPRSHNTNHNNRGGDPSEAATNHSAPRYQSNTVGADDLLSVMTQRLRTLENNQRVMQLELKEKSKMVIALTDQLASERDLRREAQTERAAIAKELADVHQFLEDYGLHWVGGDGATATGPAATPRGGEDGEGDEEGSKGVPKGRLLDLVYDGDFSAAAFAGGSGAGEEEGSPLPPPSKDAATGTADLHRPVPPATDPPTAGSSSQAGRVVHPPSNAPRSTLAVASDKPVTAITPVRSRKSEADAPKPHQPIIFGKPPQDTCKPLVPASSGSNGSGSAPSLPFNFDLLERNCGILSDHVGEKSFAADPTSKRAVLKQRDRVTVCVYSDGICVNSGPFRPYGWALCDAFLNDILEGFYPYEFKDRYPDGFPIDIVDRRAVVCPQQGTGAAAGGGGASTLPKKAPALMAEGGGGPGRRLGRAGEDPSAASAPPPTTGPVPAAGQRAVEPPRGPVRTLGDADGGGARGEYRALSAADLLQRLPTQSITPGGRIVDVKGAISRLLNPSAAANQPLDGAGGPSPAPDDGAPSSSTTASHHHTYRGRSARSDAAVAEGSAHGPQTGSSIPPLPLAPSTATVVQIRLPKGQRCVLHMHATDTVHDLRVAFEAAVPDVVWRSVPSPALPSTTTSVTTSPPLPSRYDFIGAFPRVVCGEANKHTSLGDLGLGPTCTLMLRQIIAAN